MYQVWYIKIFAGRVYNYGVLRDLSHPLCFHLPKAPHGQVYLFLIPSLQNHPFGALWSQRDHFHPHCSLGIHISFKPLPWVIFYKVLFDVLPGYVFGVPYNGSAGHRGLLFLAAVFGSLIWF
ncbi:hypothetical protein B0A79_15910 [Flavobacterium piscis]|uniref:Uncharacterized protein n=1 Tax=Flavobacterium piscis TaxID=1114874 RepID=A0ABX2XPS8_9FLAO|nr:hypothetical protein FLP_00845 [Flavobacterium piscis]OXG02424.1 hypothetical protein B0A79_15910 [Flavobacterium piscis]